MIYRHRDPPPANSTGRIARDDLLERFLGLVVPEGVQHRGGLIELLHCRGGTRDVEIDLANPERARWHRRGIARDATCATGKRECGHEQAHENAM
jgi:hypothetical protein